jgi:pimeloyl-ACP methyl ester carboxylesterase
VRLATNRIPGLVLTEHEWELPLDHAQPDRESIRVFAREVVAQEKTDQNLPWLVFFQGGPGAGGPRPLEKSGWIKRASEEFRVLLLDQRGTGRSTPVSAESITALGNAEAQAAYLRHFRADAIVHDAELIRQELDVERWSVLGQSFGGFCVTTYLSFFPEVLREALITGGLPPVERTPDEFYRATYRRMIDRNRRFYERYPQDAPRAAEIYRRLEATDVRLPSGDLLTARRFRMLGHPFGMSDGFEAVHYLLELGLTYAALRAIENAQIFDTHPIYYVLHEAALANGCATRWVSERVRREFPEFEGHDPLNFTAEHIYPGQLDEWARLHPLKEAAHLLAEEEWPRLYDAERLRHNEVPVAAAIYSDDPYVPREHSEETASVIPNIRVWVTNEFDHNGLRAAGEQILGRLLDLARGER